MSSKRRVVEWMAAAMLIVLALAYLPSLAATDRVRRWTREDGPYESIGAWAFLLASIVFAEVYRRTRTGAGAQKYWTRRWLRGHPGLLLLAGVMLLACLEEISWGQRLFGIKTPEAIARVNHQKETNLHNLEFFHGHGADHKRKSAWELTHNLDRLFSVFNLVLGVAVPLAYRRARFRDPLDRVAAPVLHLEVGALFLLNYAASRVLERFAIPHAVVEIKECNAALVWLTLGLAALLARPPGAGD